MEVAALINSGYDRADRFIHAYFTEPLFSAQRKGDWNHEAAPPWPTSNEYADRVPGVLAVGQSRFFRSLRLWPSPWSWLSWIFTIALVSAVLYLLQSKPITVETLVNKIPGWILNRLETPVPFFPDFFVNRWAHDLVAVTPLWLIVSGVAALLVVVFKVWPWIIERFRQTRTANRRKVVTLVKWARAFAPALLLFVSQTPVWVAIVALVIASVSYWAYNKPFLREIRVRRIPQ